ncbi:1-acyl-sn-glycerol-3-phosphate acyltransferase [Williamsoniiplasma lucivorax]|uniref:1-acyl-sn-glycerol-3-phosphate acyltransferase n=1 Tax=Williamsoniiplasma lucivorax TaxID=209274 RepID=A0A2S5RDU7_9MOLU|nr:1-acyl-sn-glycerol-3-phosphate acyltransferase [Williamsoniiplasma lucivorax]PPE05474.1 1-acyl-sn-glycerol-3-phosphate acyltransferase [Williamsoniiplasma lucivorax]
MAPKETTKTKPVAKKPTTKKTETTAKKAPVKKTEKVEVKTTKPVTKKTTTAKVAVKKTETVTVKAATKTANKTTVKKTEKGEVKTTKPVAKKATTTKAPVKQNAQKETPKIAEVETKTAEPIECFNEPAKENKAVEVEAPKVEIEANDHQVAETKEEKEGKFILNKGKVFLMWPSLLNIKMKAKKIARKNRKHPDSYNEEYRYNWVKKVANRMITAMNVDVKVEGIENWLDRGIVLAPNHQSNFDALVLLAINDFSKQQPIAFIAKKELWDDKSFARFVDLIDLIPLDRKSPRSAIEAFKEARQLIVDFKRSLVIFPEGTRSGGQEIGEFLPASMKIAQMANAPIVPVTIMNSYLVTDPNRPKRIEVKVVFGKPIMPQKHLSLKTEDLTKNVRKAVQSGMDEWLDKEMTYELKALKKPKKQKKAQALKKDKPKQKKSFKDLFKIVD